MESPLLEVTMNQPEMGLPGPLDQSVWADLPLSKLPLAASYPREHYLEQLVAALRSPLAPASH